MEASALVQTDPADFLAALDVAVVEVNTNSNIAGLIVAQIENIDQVKSVYGYRNAIALVDLMDSQLSDTFGSANSLIRFGESKFGILVRGLKNEGHLVLAVNKVLRVMQQHVEIDGHRIDPQIRIGVATSQTLGHAPDTLLQQAETALMAARRDNRNYLIYEPMHAAELSDEFGIANELGTALENGEIVMHYQPKIDVRSGLPMGAEALMRWISPKRGIVPPDVFIAIAESTGQIEELTWYLVKAALRQRNEWPDRLGQLSVALNIPGCMIEGGDLEELIVSARELWGVAPDQIIVEVTESMLMHPETSFSCLDALRESGVRVSIDDFGTGYSSLAYFKRLPADELKIDKSFISEMLNDEGDQLIVRTVIELAHGFGMQVTAEGVEDKATVDALAELGCDYIQGYYYSKPLPQKEFIEWLASY